MTPGTHPLRTHISKEPGDIRKRTLGSSFTLVWCVVLTNSEASKATAIERMIRHGLHFNPVALDLLRRSVFKPSPAAWQQVLTNQTREAESIKSQDKGFHQVAAKDKQEVKPSTYSSNATISPRRLIFCQFVYPSLSPLPQHRAHSLV